MKKTMRKLIPAIVMMLIAASLLGTTTYAWFSMNTTVTVTGMQVEVKSDDTYLLVSGTNSTASDIQAENEGHGNKTVALTVSDGDAKVYPSSPALTSEEAAYLNTTTGKKVGGDAITVAGVQVDTAAKAAAVTNWFTAKAANPDSATILAGSAQQLTAFTGYVIQRTAYLTVAAGANGANNLTVKPTITQKTGGSDVSAVHVLVTTSDGGFADLTNANNGTPVDIKGSNTTLTDSTVLTINIYIYYDGDNTNVYTNNKANLTGAEIGLAFDVSPVPAA